MPNSDTIDEAVRTGIQRVGAQKLDVRSRRIPSKVKRYQRLIMRLFGDRIEAGKPLLWIDVGCGYGEVLEAAKAVLPPGSRVIGVEPMKHKADSARARGLEVVDGYLQPGAFQADIISNIDVFSHIPDYHDFLRTVVSNLAQSGSFMIETGNAADLETVKDAPNELGLPDHLVFAGRDQINYYLTAAGLKPVTSVEERFDTPVQMAKNAVKLMLGRPTRVTMPYSSAYRQIVLRAGRNG